MSQENNKVESLKSIQFTNDERRDRFINEEHEQEEESKMISEPDS